MATLTISYETGTVPQVPVQLETGTGFIRVVGEIDSGSVRSLCPLHFLSDLGIAESDLVKNDIPGAPAVGPEFDTFSAPVAITAQIMIPSLSDDDVVPWDKLFPMDLVFAEADSLLLGQSDFFRCFDVSFINGGPDEGTEIKLKRCPPPPRLKGAGGERWLPETACSSRFSPFLQAALRKQPSTVKVAGEIA